MLLSKFTFQLSISILTLTGISATAQINIGSIKNAAGNAVENALERKIEKEMNKAADRMVDKYWDRVLGKYYQGAYSGTPSGDGTSGSSGQKSFPFALNSNATPQESYSFSRSVTIEVINYKKNGKVDETLQMKTYASTNGKSICTEMTDPKGKSKDMYIINDFENNAMVMLMENEGKKMSMVYGLMLDENALNNMANEETVKPDNLVFTELGIKTILGYPCKGYGTKKDDEESEIWVTDSDVFGLENMFAINKDAAQQMPKNYPKGAMMEVISTNTKNNEKVVMQVVEINKNADLQIVMADYPPFNAGSASTME